MCLRCGSAAAAGPARLHCYYRAISGKVVRPFSSGAAVRPEVGLGSLKLDFRSPANSSLNQTALLDELPA